MGNASEGSKTTEKEKSWWPSLTSVGGVSAGGHGGAVGGSAPEHLEPAPPSPSMGRSPEGGVGGRELLGALKPGQRPQFGAAIWSPLAGSFILRVGNNSTAPFQTARLVSLVSGQTWAQKEKKRRAASSS